MSIVWLASYPKSGSTWLRAVLTHYLRNDGGRGSHDERGSHNEPVSINALLGRPLVSDRETFDEYLGLESSDPIPDEVLRCQPSFREWLAETLPPPAFVKTHDAYLRLPGGTTLFPKAATAGVICLVRNPLDVAAHTAHVFLPSGHLLCTMVRCPPKRGNSRSRPAHSLDVPLTIRTGNPRG